MISFAAIDVEGTTMTSWASIVARAIIRRSSGSRFDRDSRWIDSSNGIDEDEAEERGEWACPRSFYDSHAHHRRSRDRRRPLQTLTTDITSKKASHELISSSSWSENHPAKRGPFDFACHLPKRFNRSHFPIHGSRFFWYLVYKHKNRCSVQSLIFDELYNHRMQIPMKLHRHLGKWVHLSSRCSRYSLEFNQTRCFAYTYVYVHRTLIYVRVQAVHKCHGYSQEGYLYRLVAELRC